MARLLGALLALAFACTGVAAVSPLPPLATAAPRVDAAPQVNYVALGDSYVSGPLIPVQRPAPRLCRRSTHNYPAALADRLGLRTHSDASCSGAQTADLFAPRRLRDGTVVPPQLAAVGPGTDLVTITIGANEFRLFSQVFRRCERVRGRDPGGSPCRRLFTVDGRDQKMRDASRAADKVATAVRGVRARAPRAVVYVVGYPRIFPGSGGCRALPFARGDIEWGRALFTRLNQSLRRGADREGATYVNPYPASNHHHICASQPWVNGTKTRPGVSARYHPNRSGMEGVARAVAAALSEQ